MKRKTLKQKLKSQVRKANELRDSEHQHAGITINYENQAMQAVAMAHGVMAALIGAKGFFNVESEEFKKFEEQCQARIAQCIMQLVDMGIPLDVANTRITKGH